MDVITQNFHQHVFSFLLPEYIKRTFYCTGGGGGSILAALPKWYKDLEKVVLVCSGGGPCRTTCGGFLAPCRSLCASPAATAATTTTVEDAPARLTAPTAAAGCACELNRVAWPLKVAVSPLGCSCVAPCCCLSPPSWAAASAPSRVGGGSGRGGACSVPTRQKNAKK